MSEYSTPAHGVNTYASSVSITEHIILHTNFFSDIFYKSSTPSSWTRRHWSNFQVTTLPNYSQVFSITFELGYIKVTSFVSLCPPLHFLSCLRAFFSFSFVSLYLPFFLLSFLFHRLTLIPCFLFLLSFPLPFLSCHHVFLFSLYFIFLRFSFFSFVFLFIVKLLVCFKQSLLSTEFSFLLKFPFEKKSLFSY